MISSHLPTHIDASLYSVLTVLYCILRLNSSHCNISFQR